MVELVAAKGDARYEQGDQPVGADQLRESVDDEDERDRSEPVELLRHQPTSPSSGDQPCGSRSQRGSQDDGDANGIGGVRP